MKLGALSADEFEKLCCDLLSSKYPEYEHIQPSFNSLGKTTKGTPDAYVRLSNDSYVAFQFTTQQKGVQAKILKDIAKLNSHLCHFREKVSKVVICVNTPVGSEIEIYKQEATKCGWSIQVLSLETLTKMLLDYPNLCSRYLKATLPGNETPNTQEISFACGGRVKKVRVELKLTPSEFIDVVHYPSEQQLQRIESGQEECPLSVLQRISTCTGASLEWLKHGKGSKYLTVPLLFNDVESTIKTIEHLKPEMLYFCIDLRDYVVAFVAQISAFNWQVFDGEFSLDFWNWVDQFYYIPRIYEFMNQVHEKFLAKTDSVVLSQGNLKALLSGRSHPAKLIQCAGIKGRHWADDLRDIHHWYPIAKDYRELHGEWFARVQGFFGEREKESNDS